MDAAAILNMLLTVVFICVGVALVWFVVELAKMIKSTRSMVDETNKNLQPTLRNVDKLTEGLQPTIDKTGPLMDRVNLTVDELNLELMRLDQLMSDIGDVTATASNAAGAVDTVTKAPAKLVNSVSDRVFQALNGSRTSAASAALAEAAAEREVEAAAAEPAQDPGAAQDGEAAEEAKASGGSNDSASADSDYYDYASEAKAK